MGIAPSMRPGLMSMIRARPCAASVITPAWEPVNDRASRPRAAMAIASSAIEIRSPAVSSMSSSRAGGSGLTWPARSMSSSVESPIADTTTTTWSPPLRVATMRWATRLMPSASATEDPPYFCTTRATVDESIRCRLADVEAGVRDDRVQRAQGGAAVGAPVVEVAVLPPPQRLEGPPGLVVPEPVDEIGGDRRDVVGDPERQAGGVLVRVEHLGVLVHGGQPAGQAGADGVEVRVVAHLRLPVTRQDHVPAGAQLRSGEQDLRHLEQQHRHGLIAARPGQRVHAVDEVLHVHRDLIRDGPPFAPLSWRFRHLAVSVLRTRGPVSPRRHTPGRPRLAVRSRAWSPASPLALPA